MIHKPEGDWRREPAGVSAARAAWIGGTATVRSGGHIVRAAVCAGFALLWGFAALAAGLGGSVPTLIGVGAMALGMAWAAKRAFARAGGRTASAPPAAAPAGHAAGTGQVLLVHYARPALLRSAILSALLAVAGLWLWGHAHGFLRFVLLFAIPSFAALAVLSLVKLRGDLLALHTDETSLTVATLWRRRTLAWGEIARIDTVRVRTYALYGLIRTSTQVTLVIRVRGGGRYALSPRLLDLDGRSLDELLAMLRAEATAMQAPTAVAPSSPISYPDRPEVFDADAIMARYMTERDRPVMPSPPPPAAPLSPAPAAPAAARIRTFGRKAG